MQRIATESPIQISFRRGFTIVELLIVIVVIAILAAIVVVAYNGVTRQAYEASLKSDLRGASTQLELDNTKANGYPVSLSLANGGAGVSSSDGTSYFYDYDPGSKSYCLSAVSDASSDLIFHILSTSGSIEEGPCPGAGGEGSWIVATLAGSATSGFANGSGSEARFNFYRAENSSIAGGIDIDAEGNVYVADQGNNLIRKITSSGVVSTIAGMIGDNGEIITGSGLTSSFDYPLDVAVGSYEGSEVLIVPTTSCLRVVWIDDPSFSTDLLNVNSLGNHDGHQECNWSTNSSTVPIWNASFRMPVSVVVDSSMNIYINEAGSSVVRKAAFVDGWWDQVSVLSGAGSFDYATRLGVDAQGRIYASSSNKIVRVTSTGSRSDFAGASSAGSSDGAGSAARFNDPDGVDLDASGNVYVADCGNSSIRMITPGGEVSTIAGSGSSGYVNGPGATAQFNCPTDVAVNDDGSVVYVIDLVADGSSIAGYIRKISLQ